MQALSYTSLQRVLCIQLPNPLLRDVLIRLQFPMKSSVIPHLPNMLASHISLSNATIPTSGGQDRSTQCTYRASFPPLSKSAWQPCLTVPFPIFFPPSDTYFPINFNFMVFATYPTCFYKSHDAASFDCFLRFEISLRTPFWTKRAEATDNHRARAFHEAWKSIHCVGYWYWWSEHICVNPVIWNPWLISRCTAGAVFIAAGYNRRRAWLLIVVWKPSMLNWSFIARRTPNLVRGASGSGSLA